MGTAIVSVNEENKTMLNKAVDTSILYYSELHEWFTNDALRGFSLKLALKKPIYYKVDSIEYKIDEDHFLLAAKQPHVKGYSESDDLSKAICIDICPSTIAEVFTILSAKDNLDLDNMVYEQFENPNFFNAIYSLKETELGKKLLKLIPYITDNSIENKSINRELFLDLVEQIVLLEKGNQLALNGLISIKPSTRKEIFSRLRIAISYMNQMFLQNPEIASIATHSNMSEFHFYRSFKQAYGITPYQYLLKKRLEFSRELMTQKFPIKKIATTCGFPDTSTYSKAYSRLFGQSPSKFYGDNHQLSNM